MHILFANCMDWAALFLQMNSRYGVLAFRIKPGAHKLLPQFSLTLLTSSSHTEL